MNIFYPLILIHFLFQSYSLYIRSIFYLAYSTLTLFFNAYISNVTCKINFVKKNNNLKELNNFIKNKLKIISIDFEIFLYFFIERKHWFL
jgi:hypothetical protein